MGGGGWFRGGGRVALPPLTGLCRARGETRGFTGPVLTPPTARPGPTTAHHRPSPPITGRHRAVTEPSVVAPSDGGDDLPDPGLTSVPSALDTVEPLPSCLRHPSLPFCPEALLMSRRFSSPLLRVVILRKYFSSLSLSPYTSFLGNTTCFYSRQGDIHGTRPSLPRSAGAPGYAGKDTCITFDAINAAFEKATQMYGLRPKVHEVGRTGRRTARHGADIRRRVHRQNVSIRDGQRRQRRGGWEWGEGIVVRSTRAWVLRATADRARPDRRNSIGE